MPALVIYASSTKSTVERLQMLEALQRSSEQRLQRFVALEGPKLLCQWIQLEVCWSWSGGVRFLSRHGVLCYVFFVLWNPRGHKVSVRALWIQQISSGNDGIKIHQMLFMHSGSWLFGQFLAQGKLPATPGQNHDPWGAIAVESLLAAFEEVAIEEARRSHFPKPLT